MLGWLPDEPDGEGDSAGWSVLEWPTEVRLPAREEDQRPEGGGEVGYSVPEPRVAGGGRHRAHAPTVLTLPAGLMRARVRPRATAVLALLAIVGIVALVFSVRVAAAQRAAEPVPVVSSTSGVVARSVPPAFAVGPSGADGSGPTGGGAGTPPGRQILVHVVGEVALPGVVRVADGARVVDVIQAAGGALPSADLERINLARAVVDGEQVHVPAPGEPILPGANGSVGGSAASGSGGSAASLVNLNTADLAQLDTLPGVGPVLAQRILDWRAQHGRFTAVDELGEVSGIGDKLLAQLTPKVSV